MGAIAEVKSGEGGEDERDEESGEGDEWAVGVVVIEREWAALAAWFVGFWVAGCCWWGFCDGEMFGVKVEGDVRRESDYCLARGWKDVNDGAGGVGCCEGFESWDCVGVEAWAGFGGVGFGVGEVGWGDGGGLAFLWVRGHGVGWLGFGVELAGAGVG